jgi:hypothetical protein
MTLFDWLLAFWVVVIPPLCFLGGMIMCDKFEDSEDSKTLTGALD